MFQKMSTRSAAINVQWCFYVILYNCIFGVVQGHPDIAAKIRRTKFSIEMILKSNQQL